MEIDSDFQCVARVGLLAEWVTIVGLWDYKFLQAKLTIKEQILILRMIRD